MTSHDASSHDKSCEAPHPCPFDDGNTHDEVEGKTDTTNFDDRSFQLEHDDNAQKSDNHQSQSSSTISCDTACLFVGGLHPRIGDLHLQKLFSPYGEIVRIHIVTNNPSDSKFDSIHSKSAVPHKYKVGLQQSKGYAFVEYARVESAQLAIARLGGRQLMGKFLAVRPARRKSSNQDRIGPGVNSGKTAIGATMSAEETRREYRSVQSKIEAVKRAIEQKQKGL